MKSNYKFLLVISAFLMTSALFAQPNIVLNYDKDVGCRGLIEDTSVCPPLIVEYIEDNECLLFCEFSVVNFVLTDNNNDIVSTTWHVNNGSIKQSSSLSAIVVMGSNGIGSLNVMCVLKDGSILNIDNCIELIAVPHASFEILADDSNSICSNNPINFLDRSYTTNEKKIISYLWDFGDGEYSSTQNPTYTYKNSGTYVVTLTVTNECNCSSVYQSTINVIDSEPFDLMCPNIVCEGGVETYTLQAPGCVVDWSVSGGSILQNGVDNNKNAYLIVQWDEGITKGNYSTYGDITYNSDCLPCGSITTKIPIITNKAYFDVDSVICLSEQRMFSLPKWADTEYTWSVIEHNVKAPGTYQTYNHDQRNEFFVTFSGYGIYEIECSYLNLLNGCSGSANQMIYVLPEGIIYGNEILCEKSMGTYKYTLSDYPTYIAETEILWEVKDKKTIIHSEKLPPGAEFYYNFDQPGYYQILCSSTASCEVTIFGVTVVDMNSITKVPIIGDKVICFDMPYEYKLDNKVEVSPNLIPIWYAINGTILTDAKGESVTVEFTKNLQNPIYKIGYRYQMMDEPYCVSDIYYEEVNPTGIKGVKIKDLTLNNFNYCPNSFVRIALLDLPDNIENIIWELDSINAGNIALNKGQDTATIMWNSIKYNSCELKIKLKICGNVDSIFQPIQFNYLEADWDMNPTLICGDEPFNLTIVGNSQYYPITIDWLYDGSVYTQQYQTGNVFISDYLKIDNYTDTRLTVPIGARIYYDQMCDTITLVPFNMVIKPLPMAVITPGGSHYICVNETINEVLNITYQTGLNVTSTHWYKVDPMGDILVGQGNSYTAQSYGDYYAVVTTIDSCERISNLVKIVSDNCDSSCGECPQAPLGIPIAQLANCNRITVTPPNIPGATFISWNFERSNFTIVQENSQTLVVEANAPGIYYFTYNYKLTPECKYAATSNETVVPFLADMRYNVTCAEKGYFIILHDNSTYFENALTIDYYINNINISSTTSGQASTTVKNAGVYPIRIVLTDSTRTIICEANDYAVVHPKIDGTVTFTDSLCINGATAVDIRGEIADSSQYYKFLWEVFKLTDNGWVLFSGNSLPAPIIGADEAGDYKLKGTITDLNECQVYFDNMYFTVCSGSYEGTIIGPSTICYGDGSQLTYQPSDTTKTYILQWYKLGKKIVGETGYSYTPTESGSYWLSVIENGGCEDKSMSPHEVVVNHAPKAILSGIQQLCEATYVTIKAQFISSGTNNYSYRWFKNGLVFINWCPETDWRNRTIQDYVTGNDLYEFEIRNNTTQCSRRVSHQMNMNQPPSNAVNIDYVFSNSNPYEVTIIASHPNQGEYYWSNGMVGDKIIVTQGGAYSVDFYEMNNHCPTKATINIPKDPSVYMWIFPNGCLDLCDFEDITLIGPSNDKIFYYYAWLENYKATMSDFNQFVPDYTFGVQKNIYGLQLEEIDNYGNTLSRESDPLYLYTHECAKCILEFEPVSYICKEDPKLNPIPPHLIYYFNFRVFAAQHTHNITITALNGMGVFVPAFIPVLVPGWQTLSLMFIPNANFNPNVPLQILIEGTYEKEIPCEPKVYSLWLYPQEDKQEVQKMVDEEKEKSMVHQMIVYPGVTTDWVQIVLDLYALSNDDNFMLTIYSTNGKLMHQIPVSIGKQVISLSVSNWQPGHYIVAVRNAEGVLKQEWFIKK